MYKGASQHAQHSARKLHVIQRDVLAPLDLTPEQERDNLKSRLKQVEAEILETDKRDPRRRELGLLKQQLAMQMHDIRPKARGPRGLPGLFLDVAKELLSRHQYDTIMAEAVRRGGIVPMPRK